MPDRQPAAFAAHFLANHHLFLTMQPFPDSGY